MHVSGVKSSEIGIMEEDLARALKKPLDQRHWAMVIDLRKCIGCNACTISCKAENATPPGVAYNIVMHEEIGRYPNVRIRNLPRPCMQCDRPPCVKVCPVRATWKRPDGIVVIDYAKCIGCRYCITACPYGARQFDWGEYYSEDTPALQPYEQWANYEYMSTRYGKRWKRNGTGSPIGNTRKCHFCLHRLSKGLLPACIGTCLGRARYFGDTEDPDSLVSELIARGKAFRLKEELGTEPHVFYIE